MTIFTYVSLTTKMAHIFIFGVSNTNPLIESAYQEVGQVCDAMKPNWNVLSLSQASILGGGCEFHISFRTKLTWKDAVISS